MHSSQNLSKLLHCCATKIIQMRRRHVCEIYFVCRPTWPRILRVVSFSCNFPVASIQRNIIIHQIRHMYARLLGDKSIIATHHTKKLVVCFAQTTSDTCRHCSYDNEMKRFTGRFNCTNKLSNYCTLKGISSW